MGVIIWANAGSGAMHFFGWLRYGLFLALFAGVSIWAFSAVRRSPGGDGVNAASDEQR